jgi:DNA invertase Pin-like site-specific DNA recombinase
MPGPVVRCAIYTRKSSEEGLDQAFNSLDAQREAGEAYVASQAGEGWRTLKTAYDDGGFSGGNLERPALQRLLVDIAAGRVDTVVVYKIDRLTRSLSDFAKIVDVLDARGVSFVSVTQSFNTTTSMGRLTLNVLLSFAQFEREVTGERIRDKIAASKAKGMWMGGRPPLGYDPPTDKATRALVVNEAEAQIVRLIFARYLELGSAARLEAWLDAQGVRSKAYSSARGIASGGQPFSRGALFHLLRNRTYLGEIAHKQQSHPGRHPGIVDPGVFAEAGALLVAHTQVRRERQTGAKTAPLKGRLFDADGHPMTPIGGTNRHGKVYRYYVSLPVHLGQMARSERGGAIRRVPAGDLEELILERVQRIAGLRGGDPSWARTTLLRRVEIHAETTHIVLDRAALSSGGDVDLDRLRGRLLPGERLAPGRADDASIRIVLAIRMKPRGGRTWLATPDGRDPVAKPRVDRTLVGAVHTAHALVRAHGLQGEGGGATCPSSPYERRMSLVAFLAPHLQQAILEGRQPAGLNLQRLIHGGVPLAWADQAAALGF